jgi:hypothetical protein
MATAVSICSNALLMLGDKPINSLEEGSDRARLAANLWPDLRDFVLRSHPWNCAVKRVTLNPQSTPPDFDFEYSFLMPGDWLRTLQVGQRGERPEYQIEGKTILMHESVCRLRYIWRNDNPATWDSMLVHAMTMVMKAVFAYPITQAGSIEQLAVSVLAPILKQARAVDGQEDDVDYIDDSPLYAAGFIGGDGASRYRGV